MDTGHESAKNVNSGEENSPAGSAGCETRDLSITSHPDRHWSHLILTNFLTHDLE